jgi:succinyl-CoA synthetase beta subunit
LPVRLTEDRAKNWLTSQGLPVPQGEVADSPAAAAAAAERLGGAVAVKALVAAGRRGKANGVGLVDDKEGAAAFAASLIGREIAGARVERLYVERRATIDRELYLSFAFDVSKPQIVLSAQGGIEIEETFARDPSAIMRAELDPRRGLYPWEAIQLWQRAGLESRFLPALADVTVRLFDAFRAADALTLEINPLAIDPAGAPLLVGALMEIDDSALFRHREWAALAEGIGDSGRALNERERLVVDADRKLPGGAVR